MSLNEESPRGLCPRETTEEQEFHMANVMAVHFYGDDYQGF